MKRNLFIIGLACGLGVSTAFIVGWEGLGRTLVRVVAAGGPTPFDKKPSDVATPFAQLDERTVPGSDDDNNSSRDGIDRVRQANPSPKPDSLLESLATATVTDEEANELEELRSQLASLAREKADLLNVKTLQAEIARVKTEIANLHAAQRLLDAQQTLQKIVDEFPESPSAERAKTMLNSEKASTTLQPSPDPNFGPPRRGKSVPLPQDNFDAFGPPVRPVVPPKARTGS